MSADLLVGRDSSGIIAGGFLARYNPTTRNLYRIHLRQWFDWCALHSVSVLEVKRAHIEAWARHLAEDEGRKPQTVASKLNAVCGFYRFAHLDEFITSDPGVHVRRPKIEFASSTQALTRPEFADLLKAAQDDGAMSHALVCLLGLNGLRIGECLASNIADLGHDRGYRTLHLPYRKGGKVSTMSLAVRTTWAVEQAIDGRNAGPILLGRDGNRMHKSSATRLIRRLCRQIGVTKNIHPHSLRHTFATLALDAGVPERDILDSTGHSSSRMLQYYDRNRGAIERNATHAVAAFVGAAG